MEKAPVPDFDMARRGRDRVVAVVRMLGFLGLGIGLMILVGATVAVGFGLPDSFELQMLFGEWLQFGCILAAAAILSWASGHGLAGYGFARGKAWRALLIGALAGVLMLAVQLGLLAWLGAFSFGRFAVPDLSVLGFGLFYIVLFVGVGLFEESAFRGFLLVELSRAVSFWPAAILLSALFGAVHLLNGASETLIGAGAAGLFGLVLAIAFRLTGSLWLAIGLHAGWDFGESYVFGVSNSGLALSHPLSVPLWHGPDWLTGGSVGPEGSIAILLPLTAFLALAWLMRRKTG